MSIPPLMCSTPPPLEQVECDDIGHDEFAVQYGLSQDDEDEFCAYDDFHPAVPTCLSHTTQQSDNSEILNISKSVSPVTPDEVESNNPCTEVYSCRPIINENQNEEDNIIEDLDLKFESLSVKTNIETQAKKDSLTSKASPDAQSNSILNEVSLQQKERDFSHNTCIVNIQSEPNGTDTVEQNAENVNRYLTQIENANVYASKYSPSTEEFRDSESTAHQYHTGSSGIVTSGDVSLDNEEDFNDFNFVPTEINLAQEVLGDLGFHQTSPAITVQTSESDQPSEPEEDNSAKEIEDDFNDFDAFRINKTVDDVVPNVLLGGNSDPWKNDEDPVDDFGNFQATFNDIPDFIKNTSSTEVKENESDSALVTGDGNNDDDFGDFDDFQSSHVLAIPSCGEAISREESSFSVKSFDFKNVDNENQFYESIEKSIHSLFKEHISNEEQDAIECNLESSLCETWAYLTETEVRQPYMLNWNNSIGQKTLLKSLCIDSRNILFGPKWGNMPRYAANLGATPLQPVRQASVSCASTGITHSTAPQAPIDTWSDSVHGEGQESCNDTDKPSNVPAVHSNVTSRVFKEEMLKPSMALTLQPLRQINLPDTHIFTPTDSEVPRSKTIHYDNVEPIIPQLSNNTRIVRSQTEVTTTSEQDLSAQLNSEYEDFQEFQDNSTQKLPSAISSSEFCDNSKASVTSFTSDVKKDVTMHSDTTYQTQTILEPIKVEPTIPKLNWPDPGEVKETFEDFSEFVAHSTWPSNSSSGISQNITNQNENLHKNAGMPSPQSERKTPSDATNLESDVKIEEQIDDDFDHFQFAPVELPVPKSEKLSPLSQVKPLAVNPILNNIPPNGLIHPMVPLQMQTTTIPTKPAFSSFNATHSQILQPVSLDQIPQTDKTNSQQILQPLSLESFSQINWPSPGVDLHDLSRFNPINAVHTLQQSGSGGKQSSPAHSLKSQPQEDDWGDFVSIKPTKSPQRAAAKPAVDDDDWSDFVSSGSSKSLNGLNTISFNVYTNSAQKCLASTRPPADAHIAIPTLNYITPKGNHKAARDGHFQNL